MNEIIGNKVNPFIDRSIIDRNITFREHGSDKADQNFAEMLNGILSNVNQLQIDADQAVGQMLTGDIENIHQVLIKAEEAQLSLQLTSQVVNKVLQAYQEISRMQI